MLTEIIIILFICFLNTLVLRPTLNCFITDRVCYVVINVVGWGRRVRMSQHSVLRLYYSLLHYT